MDLIDKLGFKAETTAAKKDVKEEEEAAKKLNKKASKSEKKITKEFTKIAEKIDKQKEVVDSATSNVEAKQKELEKKQEEIQEKIQKIADAQKRLNSVATVKEQKEILAEIQGLSAGLVDYISSFEEIKEAVVKEQEKVTAAYSVIEEVQGTAESVQVDAEAEQQQLAQDASKQAQAVVKTEADGAVNELTANAAKDASSATSTNLLSGTTVAPKLIKIEVDNSTAAGIRKAGAAAVGGTLVQLIGKIGQNANLIGSFQNTITSSLSNFSDSIVGGWNNVVEPMITSIGSYANLEATKEQLDTAVAVDKQTLDMGSSIVDNKETQSAKNTSNDYQQQYVQSENDNQEAIKELETPKVQIKFGL